MYIILLPYRGYMAAWVMVRMELPAFFITPPPADADDLAIRVLIPFDAR
jgi:hypothetical protein